MVSCKVNEVKWKFEKWMQNVKNDFPERISGTFPGLLLNFSIFQELSRTKTAVIP